MSGPSDTVPSPPPAADMLDALAEDVETLRYVAQALDGDLKTLAERLRVEAAELRGVQ